MTITNALPNTPALRTTTNCMPSKSSSGKHPFSARIDTASDLSKDIFGRHTNRQAQALAKANSRLGNDQNRISRYIIWPLLGTDTLADLPSAQTFGWHAHAKEFQNPRVVAVYVATCAGLCKLARNARLPMAKIGISKRLDVTERMMELTDCHYAGYFRSTLGLCQVDTGFDQWHPLRLPSSLAPSYDTPVEVTGSRLMVTLPTSLSCDEFDRLLKQALSTSILFDWMHSQDAAIHCARNNLHPRNLQRFTAYDQPDGSLKLARCEEVYIYRPRQDPAILIAIVEGLIVRHLERR